MTHNFTLLLLIHIQDPLAVPVGPCVCFLLPEVEERKKRYLLGGRSWERKLGGKEMGRNAWAGWLCHVLLLPPLCSLLCLAQPSCIQNRTAHSEREGIAPGYKNIQERSILRNSSKQSWPAAELFLPSSETPTPGHGRRQDCVLMQSDNSYGPRRVSKWLESYLHNLLSWLCLLKLLPAKAGLEHV